MQRIRIILLSLFRYLKGPQRIGKGGSSPRVRSEEIRIRALELLVKAKLLYHGSGRWPLDRSPAGVSESRTGSWDAHAVRVKPDRPFCVVRASRIAVHHFQGISASHVVGGVRTLLRCGD